MIHRVLIVDDEMRILQSLYGLLSEAFSFEIYRASSALDAQKLLMQMQFDLVITDISMPGMNGLELLKSIKRTWPRTYVILLTVYSSFEYAYEANKYDRVEYLLKIESYDEILKTVRRTVEAIEAERAQEMLHLQNELELRAARRGVEQYLIRHCVVQGKPLPRNLNFAGIGLQPEKQSLLLCTMMVSDSEPLSICEPLSDVLEKRGLQVFSLSLQAEQIFLIQRAEANDENAPEVCISAVGEELEGLNQSAPHSFFAAFVALSSLGAARLCLSFRQNRHAQPIRGKRCGFARRRRFARAGAEFAPPRLRFGRHQHALRAGTICIVGALFACLRGKTGRGASRKFRGPKRDRLFAESDRPRVWRATAGQEPFARSRHRMARRGSTLGTAAI